MLPDPTPDWKMWRPNQIVAIWESIALSLNINPEIIRRTIRDRGTSTIVFPHFQERLRVVTRNAEDKLTLKSRAGDRYQWEVTLGEVATLMRSFKWKVPPQMKAMAAPEQAVDATPSNQSRAAKERHAKNRERTLAAVLATIATADRESYIRSTDQSIIASKLAGLVEDTRANYEKGGKDGKVLSLQGIEDLIRTILSGKYFVDGKGASN